MPIPTPKKNQEEDQFMQDCMGDPVMNKDYKDQKQRAAICYRQFRTRKDKKSNASEEVKWSDVGNDGAIGLV
ncbi:MAG: hypothetical protein RLZZ196_2070 [Bacteroidota bacterium]